MNYLTWFVPLCIIVSSFFTITILILTVATLRFRGKSTGNMIGGS